MKYSDLIQFEALETIIQLRDAGNAASREKFVNSYVISDDMADKICNVLIPQLQYKNPLDNKGLLVVGNYGTGKSHLMAVISSIAEDESLLSFIGNEKVKKSAEQIAGHFKVIRVEIGGTTRDLREIIISELEMYLEAIGIAYRFPPADKLNNHKAAFEEMMAAFAEKFPGKGLLFVLDELLDFLRRRDNQQLIYDLSILREIGEVCKDLKFRFISGVQEAIFDSSLFAFMGNDVRRVRERFETVSIIKEDIKYVVSQRLLKKNVHQETRIREHLSRFTKFYGSMNEKLDDFVQLFPVHPDYIDTFEELKTVEKREILKALSGEMRKMLDQEVPQNEPGLIAFDSYWINLCADPSFRTLPNVKAVIDCSQVLESRVELSLPHKQFKPMALRIIHGLSLHRLTMGDIYSPLGATAEELRDRLCLYDKIIADMGSDEPEKELLTHIEAVLKEVYATVSGQFITRNRENNQYYLDLKKSDDYDAKIEERAKSLSPNQMDEYYYHALMEVLECPSGSFRPGFKIWPHNIIWYQRNVYRRGYLFLGTPNERSTTVPHLDFYLYFLEPFEQNQYQNQSIDEKKSDEVFFSLTNKDEKFESILKLYGGAVKQAETSSGDAKGAYQSKASEYLKQLASWLRDNNQTALSVTCQGETQTLSQFIGNRNLRSITGIKDNETLNFRDLIDTIAGQCLEPYFNDLTPEYPKFDIKITRENLNQAAEGALFAIADIRKTQQANAVLDALGLMDGGKITPYKSPYADFILGLKKNKGPGQVINRDEIIAAKDGIEYLAESKYRLEPELVMVVIAALVAAGEVVLSVSGIKYDAGKLNELARAGIDNLIKFKHLEQSKEYNLPGMQALFSMLNLPAGKALLIATQGDQASVADLQTEIQKVVKRIVETKSEIRDGIVFWDFDILEMFDSHLKNEINSLDAAKAFFESLEHFNSPGKLKNFDSPAGDIQKYEGVLNTLDVLDALLAFSHKNSSLVSWIKEASNSLPPSDPWAEKAGKIQKEIKETFLALSPVTASGIKTVSLDVVSKLSDLKAEYITKYSSWHSAVRLNANEEKTKIRLLRDVRLIALKNLSQINILPRRQIEEYKKTLESLVACSKLSSADLKNSPVCLHCRYNPLADGTSGGASKKLAEAEDALENMVDDWTETLLKNLTIPWVKENMNLLRHEYKTIIEDFVTRKKLPLPINDDFIIALKEALTSLIKVPVKVEDMYKILQQTGGSVTPGELKDIFNAYIDKLISGKDANKVRIIVE